MYITYDRTKSILLSSPPFEASQADWRDTLRVG
jgi:hypothetical protein